MKNYFSPMEIMLWYAPKNEIRAAVAYLLDKGPMPEFNHKNWFTRKKSRYENSDKVISLK